MARLLAGIHPIMMECPCGFAKHTSWYGLLNCFQGARNHEPKGNARDGGTKESVREN